MATVGEQEAIDATEFSSRFTILNPIAIFSVPKGAMPDQRTPALIFYGLQSEEDAVREYCVDRYTIEECADFGLTMLGSQAMAKFPQDLPAGKWFVILKLASQV